MIIFIIIKTLPNAGQLTVCILGKKLRIKSPIDRKLYEEFGNRINYMKLDTIY